MSKPAGWKRTLPVRIDTSGRWRQLRDELLRFANFFSSRSLPASFAPLRETRREIFPELITYGDFSTYTRMKTLDLLIIVPLLWGAYIGYKQGLLMSLVGILAFVLAVILGFKLMDFGLDLLKPYFSSTNRFLPYIAFAAIFFPIILLVNKTGQLLRKSIQYTLIGSFDSMAGALVGVFTWAFGVSVFLWLVFAVGVKLPKDTTDNTFLYPVIAPIAPVAITKASNLVPMGKDLLHSLQSAIQSVAKG